MSDEFFKVDMHTHILPRDIPDWKSQFGYGGFISLDHHRQNYARMILDDGTFFRDIYKNTWDIPTRIEEMNKTNVDIQVLSTVPVMFSYWAKPADTNSISQYLNNNLAASILKDQERFIGLGTLPMNDPDLAVVELERCVNNLNFEGIIIGSHIGDYNLDNSRFEQIYEKAEELDASIFVHPWDMPWRSQPFWAGWLAGMPAETSKTICDLIFGGILDNFPKLRFAFAHCAGSFPGTIGRIEHGFNVRPDLFPQRDRNPRKYLGKFYADTLTADPDVLRYNISVLGLTSILLGSDYPFPLGENHPGKMVEAMEDLPADTKSAILSGNVLRWLGRRIDYQNND